MILITGGAGYIGAQTNKEFYKRNYETLVLDNLSRGHSEFVKWGELIECDLADIESLRRVFKENKIDAVIHFAAFIAVEESVLDPQKYYTNNLKNTLNLLEVMLENNVKNLVFSSTAATYGIPTETPIKEDHPQNPICPYGTSKVMIEKVLEDYDRAYGLKYITLRYFNAAGADIDSEIGSWHEPELNLIPLVMDAAVGKSKHINIYGTDYDTPDGTCVRDYIHVADLASAHVLAVEYLMHNNKSDIFNLGNGSGFSVKEVIEKTKEITKKDFKIIESSRRPGDAAVIIASSEKAKKILNWTPKCADLSVILETAWKWHQKKWG